MVSLQAQLAATEATLPPLRQNLSKTKHLLAALVGHTPAQWSAPQLDLKDFTLPRDLPVTLPSELVRQRPDILAAEAKVHSASANIGVATAAMFPSFTLSAAYRQTTVTSPSFSAPPPISGASGPTWPNPYSTGGRCGFNGRPP